MALLGRHFSITTYIMMLTIIGAGVQCVIAKSFAFIFSRNSPSLGLPIIVITDQKFYDLAEEGHEISIDLEGNRLQVGGEEFTFQFSSMERKLMELGGITQAFHKYGKELFQTMVKPSGAKVFHKPDSKKPLISDQRKSQLAW